MHIQVPAVARHNYRPPMAGADPHAMLRQRMIGLGYCDESGDCTSDDTSTDTGSSTISIPLFSGTTPIVGVTTGSATDPGLAVWGDASGNPVDLQSGTAATPAAVAAATTQLQSQGFTAAQAASIVTAMANGAIAGIKAAGTPGLIPGTNLVYNPATGQIVPSTGTTTTGTTASLGSISPILLIGALGLLAVFMMERR